jgi:pyrroloquinoline quinone biosynthesis protein D
MRTVPHAFVPRLADKARLRFDRHDGHVMLVYPERGLLLNESAAAIAGMCDGTRSVDEIVAALSLERGVPRETLEHDVLAFVTDLRAKGLLE